MKTVTTALLLTISSFAVAQKVEKYYDWNWKPAESYAARYLAIIKKEGAIWHRQDFFIREERLQMDGFFKDADTEIEEGPFRYFHPNGQLQSTGMYSNGKRQGVWLHYYSNGMMQDSVTYVNDTIVGKRLGWHRNGVPSDSSFFYTDGSGMSIEWFDNGNPSAAGIFIAGGKQNGKWQYFHKNGQPSAVEMYQNGTLVSKQYFNESGTAISDTSTKDREATFPGGKEAWQKYMSKHLYFPSNLKLVNAAQAVIVVQWVINEDGNITDVEVTAPLHPDFDKVAVDVIKKSPKWLLAISHNRAVKAFRRQPLTVMQD